MVFTAGNLLTLGIVLIALVLFRQLDKNNRSLDKLRRFGDKLKEDLGAFVAEREAGVKDYAVELDVQQKAAKEALKRLAAAEEALGKRAEQLSAIEERIASYDQSLAELIRMTGRAQENLERVRAESEFADGLSKKLKDAREKISSVESALPELERRFERENAAALDRATEEAIASIEATVSNLTATAETIERRVDDHREAIMAVEKDREQNLAREEAEIQTILTRALAEAREEADRMESAAFTKMKEQALERSQRFHTAVEEKLTQLQETTKQRVSETQALVKTFKSEWQTEATELNAKTKAFRDEWKKDATELHALAKANLEDRKRDASSIKESVAQALIDFRTERDSLETQIRDLIGETGTQVRTEAIEAAEAAKTASIAAAETARSEALAAAEAAKAEVFAVVEATKTEAITTAEAAREGAIRAAEDTKNQCRSLIDQTISEMNTALSSAKIRTTELEEEFRNTFASLRESQTELERSTATRTSTVQSAITATEGELRRRAAEITEALDRIEQDALSVAAEDAARRQNELRNAVETSVASITVQLEGESAKTASQFEALAASREKIGTQIETLSAELEAKIREAFESSERGAQEETERRLGAYKASADARFSRLEALSDDVLALEAALRDAMGKTENRVRADFSQFTEQMQEKAEKAEEERTAEYGRVRNEIDTLESELAALKNRAYDNVSEKLKVFEDDFFDDLARRGQEIEGKLDSWKAELDAGMERLGTLEEEQRKAMEAQYAEDLKARLSEFNAKSEADLGRIQEQTRAFQEGIRQELEVADRSLQEFKDQLGRDLQDARAESAASTKSEIARISLGVSETLKKEQRDLDERLRVLSEETEARVTTLGASLSDSDRNLEDWKTLFKEELRKADLAVEEGKKRARELVAESDERLATVRATLEESRLDTEAHEQEFLAKVEEKARGLDLTLKDIDRRVKEFLGQTKLFDRADELKVELERRIEDLGADLDRLDQRKREAAELEAQFVKIKRLEDEVATKMTRFLSEKRRVELMEADFKRLIATAQSVDEKLAQVQASDDTLQQLQAQLRRLEDAAADAAGKYERLEKKDTILDATADGIDKNFQSLRELETQAKRIDADLDSFPDKIASLESSIEKLAVEKDKADLVMERVSSLDSTLSSIEERIDQMQVARDWLARTETRLEEVSKQAQDQVKIMGTLLKGEGGSTKQRGAPPIGVRETVVKLAHQGWAVDEIARAVKLSRGEVELILEISPKT